MDATTLGGLRSLAAVQDALGLVSSAETLFGQGHLWHTIRLRRSVALQAKIDVARQSWNLLALMDLPYPPYTLWLPRDPTEVLCNLLLWHSSLK